jgi:hypothetical protein
VLAFAGGDRGVGVGLAVLALGCSGAGQSRIPLGCMTQPESRMNGLGLFGSIVTVWPPDG